MSDNLIIVLSLIVITVAFLSTAYLFIKYKKNRVPAYTVGNVNLKLNEYTFDLIKYENKDEYEKSKDNSMVEIDSNSDQCFVFLKVDKLGKCDGCAKVEYDSSNWKLLDGTSNVYYTYVNEEEAEHGKELPALFKITGGQEEYVEYFEDSDDSATLNVSAYAIQTDGFLDASDAWLNVNVF